MPLDGITELIKIAKTVNGIQQNIRSATSSNNSYTPNGWRDPQGNLWEQSPHQQMNTWSEDIQRGRDVWNRFAPDNEGFDVGPIAPDSTFDQMQWQDIFNPPPNRYKF